LSRLLEALGGDVRLVLVVGDAGVGKTRFAGEGMTRAAAAGLVMVRGECLPLAGTLPLLPVAAVLDELSGLNGGGLLAAALDAAPGYVRAEMGRLLPVLDLGGGVALDGREDGWRRERLFSAVAELLDAVAQRAPLGLVVEDVHWADSATLDCLTFLSRGGRRGAVTLVVTCRSDEAPVSARVADWLAQVRGSAGVEEIRLGPMSRAEVVRQVGALAGGPVPPRVVDELLARAGGNPFFTEQLVATASVGPAGEALCLPSGLPARLAELLAARVGRCGDGARAVLAGLAVAGRPLAEDLLGVVTGLDVEVVRRGLHELAAAKLLADHQIGSAPRPRHALLAEAVATRLLPGERAALHERAARALHEAGDETLAAEVAGHWQAAGRPAEEMPARVAAAERAERVFGYAEAAAHWQRAIELCREQPGAARVADMDVPRMYMHAATALKLSGDAVGAGTVAEEAYRRFADHPDPATAAVIQHRAAFYRAFETTAGGLPLIRESLRLFEQAPPSAEHAEAWFDYGVFFLFHAQGRLRESLTAFNRALGVAEAVGATALIPQILSWLAFHAFINGQADEGFAKLEQGRALAEELADGAAGLELATCQSDALLKMGRFRDAAEVALHGLPAARQAGLESYWQTAILAGNAGEALMACGGTADAAAVVDPLTTGAPDRDHWFVHQWRVQIDLLRGDIDAAVERQQQIKACAGHIGSIENTREAAQPAAELALWAGRPGDVLEDALRVLALFEGTDLTFYCGRLLAAGMRACADLAENGRARRDAHVAAAALAAADDLSLWADRMGGVPFMDHPFVATIPADRASWDAERTRLAGDSDPAAWAAAAKNWQSLGCPHRAGYAWWRQAQAQLEAGQPPTAAAVALRAAASAAEGHAPLLAQVRALAQRARIPLQAPPSAPEQPPPAAVQAPYALTSRELTVLRLLAAGRTNAQIGAELYISPKTASVHVTSILRKLGVSSRVQAAAMAERAGLLGTQ
jgi:DNA-binding CsgD family transcriptional regulator